MEKTYTAEFCFDNGSNRIIRSIPKESVDKIIQYIDSDGNFVFEAKSGDILVIDLSKVITVDFYVI